VQASRQRTADDEWVGFAAIPMTIGVRGTWEAPAYADFCPLVVDRGGLMTHRALDEHDSVRAASRDHSSPPKEAWLTHPPISRSDRHGFRVPWLADQKVRRPFNCRE